MEKVSGLLKTFVIGSGIILVVGTIVLAVLLVLRMAAGDPPVPARLVPDQPVISDVALPPGARIEQVLLQDGHVLLFGTAGDGLQFIAVVDPATGRRVRLIRLVSAGGPAS